MHAIRLATWLNSVVSYSVIDVTYDQNNRSSLCAQDYYDAGTHDGGMVHPGSASILAVLACVLILTPF